MRARIGLFLTLCLSATGTSASETPHKPLSKYLMDTWDHNDGLPGSGINVLLQSSNGYLWIGTHNGLARFDGIRFVTLNRKSHSELPSNRIRTLFEDRKGDLWIGTDGGGVSTLSRGVITTRTSKEGIPSDYVRAIAEDSSGVIWIGTDGEGLCRLSADTLIIYTRENSILDERITSILVGSDSTVWVGTFNGLFACVAGRWSRFGRQDGLSSDTITCMAAFEGSIWFGTYGGGLTVLRNGRFSPRGANEGLTGSTVTSISGNRKDGLFVSTLLGGITRIHEGTVSSRHVGAHNEGEYATTVLADREGNVWVGLQSGKLVRLRDATFTWFPSISGSVPDPVRSVFEDRDGILWAGTAKSLRRLEGDNLVPYASAEGRPINILAVGQDGAGNMWVGTLGGGLQKVVGKGFSGVSLFPVRAIWALYTDSAGTLWAGSNGGLVSVTNNTPRLYTHDNSRLSHSDVRAICRTTDGSLWVGTSYGLNRMVQDTFVSYTRKNCTISNDVIISLHADANGDLWVGTIGGLNRLRDTTFTSFTMSDGLPDDAVGMILEDNRGRFWIGSDQGLYTIEKENLNRYEAGSDTALRYISLGKPDGLVDPGISGTIQPAGWESGDGRLWFATNGGVAMADPEDLRLNTAPPTLVIEQVQVDREEMRVDSIPPLSHDINQIEIAYTAPSFVKPGKLRFKYRLRGLDDDWIEAGGRRTAYFTHIPPGEYTFEVLAENELGTRSARAATLPFTILPPFWMTWWFQSAFILFFLSSGPAIYIRRVTQLKRRQAQQQEFSMRLIASQEEERKRIAAELHDSLGQNIIIIKNRALLGQQAGEDTDAISEQLEEIAKTATATLDEMRKIAHNLRPHNLERFGLTETIIQVVKDVSSASGIALQSNLENIDGLIPPEKEMHLFRIIQEALNNIVKHSHATAGSVSAMKEGSVIHAAIRDNGTGLENGADRDGQGSSGFGLEDIAHRAGLIGARFTMSSSSEGTTLDIAIPCQERPS